MLDTITKLAHQNLQQGKSAFALAHKILSGRLRNTFYPTNNPPISEEVLQQIRQRFDNLIALDWQEAENGVYPSSLLFDHAWEDFFRYYPAIWLDLPGIWDRTHRQQVREFAPEISTEGYPSYYLQNFHYQTNGYLSEMSANLYDLQVEILFNGAADAMRRRVLAPLQQGLKIFDRTNPYEIRVLDVACGTGRTLKAIRACLPQASLFGVDLSPAYLRKANQLLLQNPGELPQLVQANVEELPYLDEYFHAITCVFLFHELPASPRQKVIEECFRKLKPGGVLVICDSIQVSDSPELMALIDFFSATFYEPYYKDYINDDLGQRLEKAGFIDISTRVHFASKYWIAYKGNI